ncbi:WXG100 family type VII secretion target [Streptomyces sp. NBC_01750]|uniref:WXG100 family type VII secretion target n=1 Tax=Streptomyces sp. NBC_01750 TaxID=2975928 RepID=UPI002DDC4CEE|nr:hypothetical protein [Streptomyces sp. NBC_01750]WSD33186.1 hypothetical protein OG966_15485 [Streptomyces sp. NBC_01750]
MGKGAKGGGDGGVKTDFQSMTHDDLWAWLTPSSSGTVAGISDRLKDAAKALEELADDLKKHMEDVDWKGEAGTAFTKWGESTVSSTRALAVYSSNSAHWLSIASTAIASAHSAMPASLGSAQANAEAARKYHNDPDSQSIGSSARATINTFQPPPDEKGKVSPEALAAASLARDKARQEAIDNMRRLAGTYAHSASQMNAQKVPVFPSPPDRFVPEAPKSRTGTQQSSVGTYDRSSRTTSVGDGVHSTSTDPSQTHSVGHVGQDKPGQIQPERPVNLGIDSVDTLPPQTHLPPTTGPVPPATKPDGPSVVPPGVIPPAFGGKSGGPTTSAPGKAIVGGRGVMPPGQGGIASRMPRENGIVGGRPVTPNTGRPTVGIPRGTVIGNEGTTGARGPMGRGMSGMHGGGPMGGAGQSGISGGRRLASEVGGVVGGRPQQPGQTSARPFTPGGSGLVRGQNASASGGAHPGQVGRAGAISPGTHGANSRRDDQSGERPDYLSEDEETWQQGSRRVVPPVID